MQLVSYTTRRSSLYHRRKDEVKDKQNAAYLAKLEESLAQLNAGKIVRKTMEELVAME